MLSPKHSLGVAARLGYQPLIKLEGLGSSMFRTAPSSGGIRAWCQGPSPFPTHLGPLPVDVLHVFGAGAQILEAYRLGFSREKGVFKQFPLLETCCSKVLKVLILIVVGILVLAHTLFLEPEAVYGGHHSIFAIGDVCSVKKTNNPSWNEL